MDPHEDSEKQPETGDGGALPADPAGDTVTDVGSATLAGASPADKPRKKKKKKKKKKDGLGTTRGIETMFRTSYRVHMDLSSLADSKANIMISINGIIISIIIAAISPKIDTNPWLLAPTSFMLLGSMASIIYAIRAARPRVSSQVVNLDDVLKNRANILFFGHFTSLSEEDYVAGMTNLLSDTTALYHNMIRDIYGLGKVLTRKFELLRVSYNLFMAGLIIGILLFIMVYVWIVASVGPGELSGTIEDLPFLVGHSVSTFALAA
jgi:hypothetical protein